MVGGVPLSTHVRAPDDILRVFSITHCRIISRLWDLRRQLPSMRSSTRACIPHSYCSPSALS